jgi:hypothetical protein
MEKCVASLCLSGGFEEKCIATIFSPSRLKSLVTDTVLGGINFFTTILQ